MYILDDGIQILATLIFIRFVVVHVVFVLVSHGPNYRTFCFLPLLLFVYFEQSLLWGFVWLQSFVGKLHDFQYFTTWRFLVWRHEWSLQLHTHCSCGIKAWIQAWTVFEPMTSTIPVQCSTTELSNWELVTLWVRNITVGFLLLTILCRHLRCLLWSR